MARQGNGAFTIDGVDFRVHVKSLKRTFQVTDTAVTGRLQNYDIFREVAGTFYNYNIEVEPDKRYRSDYDTFYDIISSPVAFHILEFPYGQETIEFKAYITNGEDSLKMEEVKDGHINKWSGLSINFVAKEPYRRP